MKSVTAKTAVHDDPFGKKGAFATALCLIAALTALLYGHSFHNSLTNWDDDKYVVQNPYRGNDGFSPVVKIFSTFYQGNYHPLTLLSLNIDYAIGRTNPLVYHVFNLLLHLLNTFLVLGFILLITRRRRVAIIAALIFGIHPLHVESVAWVSERKDLLYAAFFLGSLIAYTRYALGPEKRRVWYLFSIVMYLMSLLSKGQAASLPLALIAVDVFLRKKPFTGKYLAEKIPYFLLALAFGIVAILAQQTGGAIKDVALLYRIPVACYGFAQYILKLFIPLHLSAMYPYPFAATGAIPLSWWLFSLLIIGMVVFVFLRAYRKNDRFLSFGIVFFSVTIFFVLQLLPVGRAIIADRYTYLPSVGYCLLLGVSLDYLPRRPLFRKIWWFSLVAYAVVLSVLSWQRIGIWRDSFTLWNDVIAKEPTAFEAYANRGVARMNAFQDFEGAITDCTRSLEFVRQNAPALTCRGVALVEKSKHESDPAIKRALLLAAAGDLRASLAIVPDQPNERITLGNVEMDLGNLPAALADFQSVLVLHPAHVPALNRIGFCFFRLNQPDSVIRYCTRAVSLDPSCAVAYGNIGLAWQQKMQFAVAADNYEKALRIDPKIDPAYRSNLAGICAFLHDSARFNRCRDLFRN